MNANPPAGKSAPHARAAAAEHIALDASRLARIANANNFPLLAYLIDMVVLEAWREASESDADSPTRDETLLGANGG
jgi:hypothetical protein